MKTVFRSIVWSALVAATAAARLPEPANVYYGHVAGTDGLSLTGAANYIIAQVNGGEAARAPLAGYLNAQVNYVLRVPLDDGWDARYQQFAARAGETPQLFVLYEGVFFAVDSPVPAVGARGTVHHVDLEALPEPQGVALALAWAARRLWRKRGA